MGSTYTQIHIHAVFAVKNRTALLSKEWRDRFYQYMGCIIKDQGHKVLAIGGTSNHVHLFFGLHPSQSLSSLMLRVKRETSEWINREKLTLGRFQWQNGYGAFSYSKSQISNVINYIQNQEQHHARKSFREEYLDILEKFGIEYDVRYMLDDI